jgi:hypothetical protein
MMETAGYAVRQSRAEVSDWIRGCVSHKTMTEQQYGFIESPVPPAAIEWPSPREPTENSRPSTDEGFEKRFGF